MKKRLNGIVRTKAECARVVEVIMPSPDMDQAGRINYFHAVTRQAGEIAVRAALYAGMELFRAKMEKRGTFDSWVEANCAFSRSTAYNYLALIQKSVGTNADLSQLAETSEARRRETIDEYAEQSDEKSLTQLYLDFGIIKKTPSNLGGRREGAGRPRKNHDIQAEAKAIADDREIVRATIGEHVGKLFQLEVKGAFGALDDAELAALVTSLQELTASAKAILKGRKA